MIKINDIPKEKINRIRNLWEKLNKMHYEDSIYFEDHYEAFTFSERIEPLIKINEENIKISIISNGNSIQGYCISSVDDQIGEIDSIYIEEEVRDRGLGKELINNHIKWMKERGCVKIKVAVSFGHDSVIDFYHKLGFYERLVYYELKDSK